ncbi:MAG: hypothetical protein MJ106_00530 [Lentisphaeria bacterium]|nr:hypothetical protein [Lentisphaeria bacterium]
MSINSGTFSGCYASNGGAISIEDEGASLSLFTFDFTSNETDGSGGALFMNAGALNLGVGYFRGNSSVGVDGLGGAIYASGTSTTLSISRTDFQGNQASFGGALYLDGIYSCEIIDSRFFTGADSIYVNGASSVVFSGENTISASVMVVGGTASVADNAKLIFGNTGAISFDGVLGANNTIELNNGDMVTLTNGVQNDTAIIVNSGSDYTLVGDSVNVLKASGLTADTEVTYKGVDDSIANHEGLSFNATDSILSAAVTFYGCVASQSVQGVGFAEPETVYSESFDEVVAGGAKEIVGDQGDEYGATPIDPGKYIINGDIFAADNWFSMSNLTYGGHIYGGDKVEIAPEEANPCSLTLDNIALSSTKVLKVTGEGSISSATEVTSGGSELQIGFVGTKKAGTVYGGAEILSTGITYNAGAISTTVNGGYFGKIVGNGSTGNYGGIINQGASTLTINGGVFYGRVYAGGYAMSDAANEDANMATSEIVGRVDLYINGGTFKDYVYGGSCAQYDYLADNNTHIEGNVTVIIDCSENKVKFNTAVFAGSQSEGKISGNTKVVFSGSGENLDFSGCTDGIGRIYGGSQNERDYASASHDDYLKCVSGDRSLEFNGFSGTIHADFFNFDTVTFSGSSVTLDTYTDLHLVDTWNFDLSGNMVNLNWTATDAENNFAGDTINLKGWDGASTCTFMTGSDAALDGFDKATVKVYNGSGALVTSGYNVSRVNNTLQIAVA